MPAAPVNVVGAVTVTVGQLITSVAVTVSARLIPAHYAEWKRLGGIVWLRQQLRESIQKQKEQIK